MTPTDRIITFEDVLDHFRWLRNGAELLPLSCRECRRIADALETLCIYMGGPHD